MSDFLQSLTEYIASLEQRLSALESALSVMQTQWAVAQTKEKEQEAVIASLEAKNNSLQSCITAQEERIAALEKAFADGEWAVIPEEMLTEAAEEPVAEEPIVDEEKVVAEETVAPKANLYGKPVDDIKQAIALGDRFLFQRELFRQNVELMQRTFADINALHSFDEAITYLDKRFDWDKESNTYALFLTALHRRFS